MEITNDRPWEKYYRKTPIKDFDVNQTLYSLVKDENKNNLNNQAIGFLGNNFTYKNLFKTVDQLADAYRKAGVQKGDTVAICTINTPAVQQNLLALSKIGAISKWIDLRSKDKDLIKNLNSSNCKFVVAFEEMTPLFEKIVNETDVEKVLISSPKDYLPSVIRVLAKIKDKKEGKLITLPEDTRFMKFTDFVKTGDKNSALKPVFFEKDRPTLSIQSSGSTGKAKNIIHTDYNFNSEVLKLSYTDLPLYREKTLHVSVPPFIIYGLCNSIYTTMVMEMKAEMTPFVSEVTVYDDLGKFDIPFAAPLHYRYMQEQLKSLTEKVPLLENDNSVEAKKELKKTLKELDRVLKGIKRASVFVSGGDKISAEEIIEMQHLFDKVIINGYGNNEVVGAAVVSPVYANKPGSIGVPLRGIEVHVFDPETNEQLPQEAIGELCLSTDHAFVKYQNNPEATSEIKQLHDDGKYWIHTGDLCHIDEDGFITPKGRCKRLIKKEAFKISPDTIEDVIQELPFVKECVVVGVPDKKSLSVPMAFVELEDKYKGNIDALMEQIYNVCEEELPDYEIPSYVEEIDEIPFSNNKRNFRKLEDIGSEMVNTNKAVSLVRKK